MLLLHPNYRLLSSSVMHLTLSWQQDSKARTDPNKERDERDERNRRVEIKTEIKVSGSGRPTFPAN